MFIAKFDGNGTAKGLRQSGGKKGNFGNILLNDKENYLYLLGNFSYNFAFETDSISTDSIFNANAEDIFFAKFFDCDNADKLHIGKDTTFCGSVTLEGNAGFKKYVWNTGQKTSRITVNQTNDYKLSAIDRHKCPVASNLVHIIVNEKPYVFLGNDIYTAGSENFVLSGGDFAGYSWSRGDTTKTIEVNSNNLNVGINSFSLTAKNGLGCKAVDEINIVVESPLYSVGNPNYLQITNIAGKTSSNKQTEHNLGSLSNVLSMPEGSVYPNPSTGKFSVKIGGLFETIDVDVYVTDEKGQTVFNKRYLNRNVIDIVLKTAGVYVVNVKSGDKVFCGKVVVE